MIIWPFFQIAISVLSIPTIHIPLYPSLLLVLYSTHPLLLAVAKSISITAFLLAVHDSHLLYSSPIGCLYYIFLVPPLFVPYSFWLPLLYIPGSPLFVPYFYWLPLLYSIVLVPPVRPLLLLVASTINSWSPLFVPLLLLAVYGTIFLLNSYWLSHTDTNSWMTPLPVSSLLLGSLLLLSYRSSRPHY